MSRNGQAYRRAPHDIYKGQKRTGLSENLIYGNTARKAEFVRELEEAPAERNYVKVRENREKAYHMSAGYVLFLIVALFTSAFILVNYIQMEAELTNLTKMVAAKESELNNLKLENDEAYNRVVNSVDLEEIRRIATEELGMVYAQEGQIVIYENQVSDYMRRVTENNR